MARIAVVGAGAIGGFVGGMMQRAGQEVTLIEQWPEHVEAMRQRGLRLSGMPGEALVKIPVRHIYEVQGFDEPFDVVLIAVKTYDTEWATMLALPHVTPDGTFVVCQNGVTDARVAALAGRQRTVGCVVTMAGILNGPGDVQRTDRYAVAFRIGELDHAHTSRAEAVAALFADVSTTQVTTNLAGERWSKLATNCMTNAVTGLTGMGAGEVRATPEALPVLVALGSETVQVGASLGVRIEPIMGITAERMIDAACGVGREHLGIDLGQASRSTSKHPSSMLQDIRRGRRTEIDDLNGYVARLGREVGIPTPMCDAVVAMVKAPGVGKLVPDIARLEQLRAIALANLG